MEFRELSTIFERLFDYGNYFDIFTTNAILMACKS